MAKVREQLEHEAKDFGIDVIDVRIRRADLPEQNSQAVYQRMQTERQREAAEFRAKGSQRAQEIRATAPTATSRCCSRSAGDRRCHPRRRRRRAQPHLCRCVQPRSGLLRASTGRCRPTKRDCAATPGCCSSRIWISSAISSIRAAGGRLASARSTDHPQPRPGRHDRRRSPEPFRANDGRGGCGRNTMSDFIVAIGLVLAIEGLIFAAFPGRQSGWRRTRWKRRTAPCVCRRRIGGGRCGYRVAGARLVRCPDVASSCDSGSQAA